jgi:hypothetical protein
MAMVGWDIENYRRCRPYTSGRSMLMLGNQFWSRDVPDAGELFGVTSYQTLDMDSGDIKRDLDTDLSDLDQTSDIVMNIGTLEHCWNAHQAHINAARMVRTGGYYIGHAPVRGYFDHAVHITDHRAIQAFFAKNGFAIQEHWLAGNPENAIYWMIAQKLEHRKEFLAPKQIWVNGQDQGIA